MLQGLSPQRRRFLLAVVALGVVAVLGGVVSYVATRPPDVTPVSQDNPGPVLLVPGYGGSTASLEILRGELERAGRDTLIVTLAGDGTGDLRSQAQVLGNAVAEALASAEASSVDVIGYSAGGVIARLWVDEFGGGDYARRVVTLGSPHHGTEVAGLASDLAADACPLACRQLVQDSDLLRSLNARDETPDGPLWVSIWTADDKTVVPPDSASLEGAVDFSVQSVCASAHVEHSDLPRDPVVVAMTLAQLGRSAPDVPSSAEVCQV